MKCETVPAHTVRVERTFVITLAEEEAVDLFMDLKGQHDHKGLKATTYQIWHYLANRNNL